jgi:hypothetical protein
MIECTRCGNGASSVAEIHLMLPQEHPDQGLMVKCHRCYYQRLIEEIAQGNVTTSR